MLSFTQWLKECKLHEDWEMDDHAREIMDGLLHRIRTIVSVGMNQPSNYDGKEFWHVLDELEELMPGGSGQEALRELRHVATKILEIKSRVLRDAGKPNWGNSPPELLRPYQQEVKPYMEQCLKILSELQERYDIGNGHPKGLGDSPQFQKHVDAYNKGMPFGALPRSSFGRTPPKSYTDYQASQQSR